MLQRCCQKILTKPKKKPRGWFRLVQRKHDYNFNHRPLPLPLQQLELQLLTNYNYNHKYKAEQQLFLLAF